MFKPTLRRSAVALAALCLSSAALAQQNVTRIIVPFNAGGPIDVTARILAEGVQEELGTVIIENKPGAGGNIGSDHVAKAKPDGKTLGVATLASHAVNPWIYPQIPFDADKDFAGVTLIADVPNVLVMNTLHAEKLGINSVQDLIEYAKANPNKLNYGSGGNGSGGHLAGELFKSRPALMSCIFHIMAVLQHKWLCYPLRSISPSITLPQLPPISTVVSLKH